MQMLIAGGGVSTPSGTSSIATNTLGGLPDIEFTQINSGGANEAAGYVIPLSTPLNPAGYTYQTFGTWIVVPASFAFTEGYFTSGIPTAVSTLPASGTAAYTGQVTGSLVDAPTREPSSTIATINAVVDFAMQTVMIATTATSSLSNNAGPGTTPTQNAALNLSGVLAYTAGSNTFTGTVTSANGMTGNATGRFYGAGISAATSSKVIGSPPEIGGTFALFIAGAGMQGAFGSK